MAEHRVRKDNIIYIIPTDELFIKWKNDEAFIDEYGRLMNRKPHRVLKELKPYAAESEVQESYASPIKDLVRDKMVEYSKYAIDRAGDVFFYEVIPNVWHKHIVPLWNGAKDVLFSKEIKIDQIKCETEHKVVENQLMLSEIMTKEEVDAEKRKLLYHWIGMLSSLDWNYDGVVMQPAVTDVPDKKKIVRGIYDIPEDAGTIRVKITDLLAESLEMEVE